LTRFSNFGKPAFDDVYPAGHSVLVGFYLRKPLPDRLKQPVMDGNDPVRGAMNALLPAVAQLLDQGGQPDFGATTLALETFEPVRFFCI
jgi:hypothetical protein